MGFFTDYIENGGQVGYTMNMTRLEAFKALKDHPWLGRSYKKLSKADEAWAIAWLEDNKGLTKDQAPHHIVRLWLDKPRPKAWKEIEELLMCANSSLPKT